MKILIISICVSFIISSILKFVHWALINKDKQYKITNKVDLLSETPSYVQFKQISKEHSVGNGTIRTQGDFVDFIINDISLTDNGIENKVLRLNYGDNNEG